MASFRLADVAVPPWRIDAAQLRASLDTLRNALASTPLAMSFARSHDHGRVATRVRGVLERLQELDLEGTQHALVPSGGPFTRAAEQSRLVPTLDALHNALARRVRMILGARKVNLLRDLLVEPVPSLLDLLNRADSENAHSDVLAWLLNSRTAPRVAPAALAQLTAVLDDPAAWAQAIEQACFEECLSVRREFVIGREWTGGGELDRVDLVISGPGFVLAIENKVWALEHRAQTTTYWRWLEALPERHAGLFLTPTGRFPSGPGFMRLSYVDLLSCLLEAPARGEITQEERTVLAAYVKTLRRHVLRSELRAVETTGGPS